MGPVRKVPAFFCAFPNPHEGTFTGGVVNGRGSWHQEELSRGSPAFQQTVCLGGLLER